MKKSEFSKKIAAMTAKAKAYAIAQPSWTVYEGFKTRIACIASDSKQYERAIQNLTAILGV